MDAAKQKEIIRGSLMSGVINGVAQYFSLKDKPYIAITVDSITNNENTVLGSAVVLAISLAMISTVITYIRIKDIKVKFFPTAFWSVVKHGFFSFGVITSLAVLWQRYMGTVEVPLFTALLIIGLIAGIVAGTVNYLTLRACTIYEAAEKQPPLVSDE